MSQPHHAAEAIRIRVNVGYERDGLGIRKTGQKTIRSTGKSRSTVDSVVGAATRHSRESSKLLGIGPRGDDVRNQFWTENPRRPIMILSCA